MANVLFFIAGIGAVCGAIGVVMVRNPFYAVLALVFHLLSLAALFLLLQAQFVAAAQVVVYAGAVMVLYVFVVAYVGGSGEPLGVPCARVVDVLRRITEPREHVRRPPPVDQHRQVRLAHGAEGDRA